MRQPLYSSSVGRWKVYEQQLAVLQQRLAPLIARYEQQLQVQLAARAAAVPDEAAGAADSVAAGRDGSSQDEGVSKGRSKDEL